MTVRTNAELDTSFQLISQDIKEMKETLSRIEQQTTKTNGRVSSLENWKGFITGGLAVIVTLALPVVFILVSNFLDR